MKKLALILLLLSPLLFSGCASAKDLESKGKQTVVIETGCNWSMSLYIRVKGDIVHSPMYFFNLGKEPKTVELYKDTDYTFGIKGAYDYDTILNTVNYKDYTYILIDWDTYKGGYRIRGR